MNQDDIRDLIQQVIDENKTSDQFAVSQTSYHTHNDFDSPALQFIRLSDVPTAYYKQAGKIVTVNSTENGLIFQTPTSIYSGELNSDGTAQNLPTGWSSVHNSTGDYTITHNLGTTNYNMVATASQFSAGIAEIATKSANTVEVIMLNVGSTPSNKDQAFDFILIPY